MFSRRGLLQSCLAALFLGGRKELSSGGFAKGKPIDGYYALFHIEETKALLSELGIQLHDDCIGAVFYFQVDCRILVRQVLRENDFSLTEIETLSQGVYTKQVMRNFCKRFGIPHQLRTTGLVVRMIEQDPVKVEQCYLAGIDRE